MRSKALAPRILFPRTVNEALELAMEQPTAIIWAGGTWLSGISSDRDYIDLPSAVISLGRIDELHRASRSDRALELGAMMTLDQIAGFGPSTLPSGLSHALTTVGTRPLRCRATLGGHLAVSDILGDLWPLLVILDTQVEIKYLKNRRRRRSLPSVRRIPLAMLEEKSSEDRRLMKGEIITRIRIPNEPWDYSVFQKVLPKGGNDTRRLLFAGIARVEKGFVTGVRIAVSIGKGLVLRNRDLEADLSGRSIPLNSRERESVVESLDSLTAPWAEKPYERESFRRMAVSFLDALADDTYHVSGGGA